MQSIMPELAVNTKTATLLVKHSDITVSVEGLPPQRLDDTPWSRWYLRTHFKKLLADPAGQAWYKQHDPMQPLAIPGLLSTPRPYQWLGIRRMTYSNCAEWLDMGLGKTLISIAFSLHCHHSGVGSHFLVVCPPTIFVSWQDEIQKHIDPNLRPETYLAHGTKKQKVLANLKASRTNAPKFIITSYETLANISEHIVSLPIAAIFADESSKAKNPLAQRTRALHGLADALPNARKFCLSGTPATKSPLGFYSQYEFLGAGFSESPNYAIFEKKYCISKLFMMVRLPHGKVTSIDADTDEGAEMWLMGHSPRGLTASYKDLGYSFSKRPKTPFEIPILNYHRRNIRFQNLEDLHRITQKHAYTLYKSDVLTELPPKIRMKRQIELSDEQRKAYQEMLDTNRTLIGSRPFSFHDSGSPYAKLHQIANGYLIDTDRSVHVFKNNPKMQELEQILEESGDSKIIVWAPFRPLIEHTVQFVTKLHIPALQLHGDIPIAQRGHIVHEFQDPAGPRLLIANPAVAGMGLNLTCATLEVFITNWFAPDVRIQAEDRAHRMGQKNTVTIVDLVASNTLEVAILRNTLAEINLERAIISMTACMGGNA